jgi:site-specific DNA-cytosine methylase
MTKHHKFTIGHMYCGIGGNAIGAAAAEARWKNHAATFETVGGIDFDELACVDFQDLAQAPALCADMHKVTPAMLRKAWGRRAPDFVMSSPPCKGYSGLLSAEKAKDPKYERMNELLERSLFLLCSTWKEPPAVIFFENVPRIASRGKAMISRCVQMLQAHGYSVHAGNHDCGEVGGLAQHRRRWFMVARHRDRVPQAVYHPPKHRVRGCGEVLGTLPIPGDVARGGPMHSIPGISWRNWVRLALIPAGGDWRDLPNVVPEGKARREVFRRDPVGKWEEPALTVIGPAGNAAPNVADPRPSEWGAGRLGVKDWSAPAAAVTGEGLPTNGANSVADPRVPAVRFGNVDRVTPWEDPVGTVTHAPAPSSGGGAVADPRPRDWYNHLYRVTDWEKPTGVVTGASKPSSGAVSVADPRVPGWFNGTMGVEAWTEPTGAVTGNGRVNGSGPGAVADPRIADFVQLTDNPTRHRNKYAVADWEEPAPAVIGASRPGSGAASVADPRFTDGKKKNWQQVAGVTPWSEPIMAITSNASIHAGAFQVADPRAAAADVAFTCEMRSGTYRVIRWEDAAATITGSASIDNGAAAVADPRINPDVADLLALNPDKAPPFTPVIIAPDGTWHRPLTTLELAALQGFPTEIDGKPLQLAGDGHTRWREAIGNAVPPPAAMAVAGQFLRSLLIAKVGGAAVENTSYWVSPDDEVDNVLSIAIEH